MSGAPRAFLAVIAAIAGLSSVYILKAQNVTGKIIYAPRLQFPAEALKEHAWGSGIFLLRVQINTGRVEQVIVGKTTGNKALDDAAIKGFSQWRFAANALKPTKFTSVRLRPPLNGREAIVEVPVTFLFHPM
jgi:TonB family protein